MSAYAGVAQLVEQLICNQQVGGSSPSTSSTISYGGVPEWPKGADCKSVVDDFDGSNPSSSTKSKKSELCPDWGSVWVSCFFSMTSAWREAAVNELSV